MIGIYSIIKLVAPSGVVGALNLVTYLSFSANSRIQTNNRNWKLQDRFKTLKKEIFDNIIDERDTLINKRYGTIESFFKNQEKVNFLKKSGGQKLVEKWEQISPKQGETVLKDELAKNNFFQEVRIFCISNKDTEDKRLLAEISNLCSNKIVKEQDFNLLD